MVAFGATIYCEITLTRLRLAYEKNQYVDHASFPILATYKSAMGYPCRNNPQPRHVRLLNSASRRTHRRHPV